MSFVKPDLPPEIEYRYLSGNSGVKVSNLCLGTMTFGIGLPGMEMPGNSNENDSHLILDRFSALGGNFLDTANMYSAGDSERYIGSWFAKRGCRDKFVVSTKVRFPVDPTDPNGQGLSRKHIISSVEDSLKRLQTDYIDLFHIHCWDKGTPVQEVLRTLDDLVRVGKIRYAGASNVTGWQLQKIVDVNRYMGFAQFVSLQAQYSLLVRELELELFDVCVNEGIGLLPWSPLRAGMLTGKFKRDVAATPTNTRIGMATKNKAWDEFYNATDLLNSDFYWELIAKMKAIADTHKKSVPQVALRWLLQRQPVSSVVIGAKNIQQLEDNMAASTGWSLTDTEMDSLTEASNFPLPYPYNFIARANASRAHSGVNMGVL